MIRSLVLLLVLAACATGVTTQGGQKGYVYDPAREYDSAELRELAPKVVSSALRDPPVGTLAELFSPSRPPLRRLGVVVFETRIQPTYDGLAGENEVYLSAAGKQLVTENFLAIWEESFRTLAPELDLVGAEALRRTPSYGTYGRAQEDLVLAERSTLAPDDVFFLEKGRKTTTTSIVNPRGARDVSFLLVPAGELMSGPKWSEQNKHFLNDLAKEAKLDAGVVALTDVSWTRAHTDKHSGEVFPEEFRLRLRASVLVPLSAYHARLRALGNRETPNVTLCYRAYEAELRVPVNLRVPAERKTFETIEAELLGRLYKSYKDLAQLTILRIRRDLEQPR
jgi:hypothetical protein